MRIDISCEFANREGKTGIERYAKQMMLHLASCDRTNRYTLYLGSEPQDWLRDLPDSFEPTA